MQSRCDARFALIPSLAFLAVSVMSFASAAFSGQMVSTPARTVGAVMETRGFTIQPVGINPAPADDLAPQQLFEIVRPGGAPFAIGRMFTSCSCIRLEADSRSFGQGERAGLRLRNIIATPPAGQTYSFFVQIVEPIKATLRYDTFMQSSQFIPSPDGVQPTRGNIVADGILIGEIPEIPASSTPSASVKPSVKTENDTVEEEELASADESTDFEIIVPKADNYIPDTSEYTLRKKEKGEKDAAASGALSPASGEPGKTAGINRNVTRIPVRLRPETREESEPVKTPAVAAPTANAGNAADENAAADSLWQEVRPRTPVR